MKALAVEVVADRAGMRWVAAGRQRAAEQAETEKRQAGEAQAHGVGSEGSGERVGLKALQCEHWAACTQNVILAAK